MSESKRFSPAEPVALDPPKDDPITVEELAKADGEYLILSSELATDSGSVDLSQS